MNFEHLLHIYWSKGFFYNKTLKTFNIDLFFFFKDIKNFNFFNQKKFIKRFELAHYYYNRDNSFLNLNLNKRKLINIYLAQHFNVIHFKIDLIRYNLIRLYLIKSFRGIAEFLSKPVNGQRTWSNKKNAKKLNKIVKNFINQIKKKFNLITNVNLVKNKKFLQKKKKKKY